MKMKKTYVITTNKLIFDLFNVAFNEEDVKIDKDLINGEWHEYYYFEFMYISSKNCSFKVRISSSIKDYLRFTIYEKMLLFILVSNARQTDGDNHFITMRKLRNIRGLKDNSLMTYNCYKTALDRLTNKKIKMIPFTGANNYIIKKINCNILNISDVKYNKSRIMEFSYCFNDLETSLVNNSQSIGSFYNPFAFIFKKYFAFQLCLHLMRLLSLNKIKEVKYKEFSYQKMLKQIHKVDQQGFIENINYYDYIATSEKKQSDLLKKSIEDLEIILSNFCKDGLIKDYSISNLRTFKYLRDDEVKISIRFT